jgi:hypothetical protein
MARQKQETVEYFPHNTQHKQTIFNLRTRFGNDGYAFWFTLLEKLGTTKGHALRQSNEGEFIHLCSQAMVTEEQAIEILDLCARLEAIDRELWEKAHIIWSQNFVNNLTSVYRKRKQPLPQRPSIPAQESTSNAIPAPEMPAQPINPLLSGAESTQRKGEERRVEERKGEDKAVVVVDGTEDERAKIDTTKTVDEVLLLCFGPKYGKPANFIMDEFRALIKDHGRADVYWAIIKAAEAGEPNIRYVRGCLNNKNNPKPEKRYVGNGTNRKTHPDPGGSKTSVGGRRASEADLAELDRIQERGKSDRIRPEGP